MPEICRMCSKTSTLLVPMLKHKDELEEVGSQFEDCFGIKVLATPGYTSICSLCHKKLCCFYEFKREVLKTHEKLIEHYKGVFLEEKDIKCEILDNSNVEYFEDGGTCLMFNQKFVEEANSFPASSHRSIGGPSSLSASSKESIKVQSVTDSPDVILPKETVKPRQIPSPIIKIEGLREKMISLEKDKEKEEDEQDDENDDEFDEIQDDELEEIERISLGDLENLSDDEDFNSDYILEGKSINKPEYGTTALKCNVCKNIFSYKKRFEIHKAKCKQSSLKPKIWTLKYQKTKKSCELCNKTFISEEILNAHMNKHKGLPAYSCEICGKDFNHKTCVTYHMRNHNNERPFKCEICSKAFLSKGDLSRHLRVHNDERPYVCHICGKRYKLLTNLKEHSDIHAEENLYECKMCKIKLRTRTLLRRHVNIFHQVYDSRLYCALCKRQFNRRYRFINHLKSKHPGENEEMMSKVERRVMKKFPSGKLEKR